MFLSQDQSTHDHLLSIYLKAHIISCKRNKALKPYWDRRPADWHIWVKRQLSPNWDKTDSLQLQDEARENYCFSCFCIETIATEKSQWSSTDHLDKDLWITLTITFLTVASLSRPSRTMTGALMQPTILLSLRNLMLSLLQGPQKTFDQYLPPSPPLVKPSCDYPSSSVVLFHFRA